MLNDNISDLVDAANAAADALDKGPNARNQVAAAVALRDAANQVQAVNTAQVIRLADSGRRAAALILSGVAADDEKARRKAASDLRNHALRAAVFGRVYPNFDEGSAQ